ncbi:MAG: FAD-dependent oxidoreductase [Salinivirgaceae bacterium]|jgi:hypothetical protein|nr:FAD-dependent oxidoreductase [Salinivirgaceae bacterium]
MKNSIILFIALFATAHFVACSKTNKANNYKADVIIYGGTSAAIISAVEVVKSGKTAIVVSPDKHIGGLSSSGLGFTDTGNKEVIGGLSHEFYRRVYLHYNDSTAWKWQEKSEYGNKGQNTPAMDSENKTMWIFEPHVAENIFEGFVKENKITVLRDEWLNRETGVVKKNGKIVSIKTLSGNTFVGKIFIDATYEGDLMAAANVSYHVGREANSVYNETWNGVQIGNNHHSHHFKWDIDPYKISGKPESGLLFGISNNKIGANGTGDNKLQAYCFRMCMSNKPENLTPFPKPEKYDATNYELLVRVFDAGWRGWFNKFDIIPNRKTDTNNNGPFSTDYIGANYDYPEATYERRREIIKDHENYQKGLLYFAANDPKVPIEIRTEMKNWGLAKDEFVDNGNWPYQLYVREARRMIGEYVLTENDAMGKTTVPKPVGMGSYTLDSHNVQRIVTSEGFVQNEGDVGVHPHEPYQIPYGSICPKKEECTNLLVPVCASTSHIAYGSVRMEPVFMILGQAAAAGAVLAIDQQTSVQDVDYNLLKNNLLKKGAVLSLNGEK